MKKIMTFAICGSLSLLSINLLADSNPQQNVANAIKQTTEKNEEPSNQNGLVQIIDPSNDSDNSKNMIVSQNQSKNDQTIENAANSSDENFKNAIKETAEMFPFFYADKSDAHHDAFNDPATYECLNKAFKIISDAIVTLPSGLPSNISEIFTELRKVLPADKFSDEDIFGLIDDAIEIRCKLSLTIDLLIRSAYAKLAVQVGIAKRLALDLCSSNYLQLPKFVVMTFSVRDETLDKVLAELGSGIVWKDRIKFEILNDKYFGSGKKLELKDFEGFSQKIACYAWLVSEIAEFFEDYRRHVVYKIAQNFYVNNIDIEKIKQIFELSNDEIKLLIPHNYKNF